MNTRWRDWLWSLLATSALVGCDRPPASLADSGTREAVLNYYAALLRHDWPGAYAALHPDTRKRFKPEQFAQLAQRYLHDLGFEPTVAHLRSCEEHGAEATAHVLYEGHDASGRKLSKEAVILRRYGEGWGIFLPSNFGRSAHKGAAH